MLVGTGGVLDGYGMGCILHYTETVLGLGPHCYCLRAKAQTVLLLNRALAQIVLTLCYSLFVCCWGLHTEFS